MRAPAVLLFASLAIAQKPVPASDPTELELLARRVEEAHRPRGPVPPVTALQCYLTLHVLDPKAAQGATVDLEVKFLSWQRPDKQVRPLIRYEVRQAGKPIVRGRDQYGYWHLFQGEPTDLSGDYPEDLKACERDTNLARQMIRFTDPGTVIRSLVNPGPVRDETLTLDRNTKVPCQVVEGDLAAFPLLQQAGEDAPVRLEIFVRKDKPQTLLAIDACPLVEGKKVASRGERVHLLDLRERDDLLVPHELVHLFRGPEGQLELKTKVTLIDLKLRPELRVEDFDRKKKK